MLRSIRTSKQDFPVVYASTPRGIKTNLGELLRPHIRERVRESLLKQNPALARDQQLLDRVTHTVIAKKQAPKHL